MRTNFPDALFSGGDFDLEIELGETNDSRLRDARSKLWEHRSLVGCYMESEGRDSKIDWSTQIVPDKCSFESRLFGVATTPNGIELPCYSLVLRYGDGVDRLSLSIPFGALELAYGTDVYENRAPAPTELSWLFSVSDWFADIGDFVFSSVRYRYALIGDESSVCTAASEIHSETSSKSVHQLMPGIRWCGYLVPDDDRLVWYPPY